MFRHRKVRKGIGVFCAPIQLPLLYSHNTIELGKFPALRKQRQEGQKFKILLNYIANLSPACLKDKMGQNKNKTKGINIIIGTSCSRFHKFFD